jgi:hypothetical protein
VALSQPLRSHRGRGRALVALNNGTKPAEVRLPVGSLPPDALGVCAPPWVDGGTMALTVPAPAGCVF